MDLLKSPAVGQRDRSEGKVCAANLDESRHHMWSPRDIIPEHRAWSIP